MAARNVHKLDEAFLRRLLAYQDGALDSAELAALDAELRDDARKRAAFVELHVRSVQIRTLVGHSQTLDRTRAGVAPRVEPAVRSRGAARYAATAACVLFVAMVSLLVAMRAIPGLAPKDDERVLARLTFAQDARWAAGSAAPGDGELLGHRRYELLHGRIRLQTLGGTLVTLAGPASFDLVSHTALALEHGRVSLQTGPRDSQYTVTTRSLEIIDRGTAFGVEAAANGKASVVVFDGQVVARQRGRAATEVVLDEGAAAAAEAGQPPIRRVPFDPAPFAELWPLTNGVDELSTIVEFLPPGPLHALGGYHSDTGLLMVAERQSVLLDRSLPVDAVSPGEVGFLGRDVNLEVQAGTRVSSFLLFFSQTQTGPDSPYQELSGSITFARPIAAVIGRSGKLRRTDSALGLADVDYSFSSLIRGLGANLRHPPDTLQISADQRTLRFHLWSGRAMDQFRVLVAAE